jgi:hypothetical protein
VCEPATIEKIPAVSEFAIGIYQFPVCVLSVTGATVIMLLCEREIYGCLCGSGSCQDVQEVTPV